MRYTSDVGPLPDTFLIGAMKAGTTSLASWLAAHPQVFVAPQKEVRYFNHPFHFWLGEEWYREQFVGHDGEPVVVDATPMVSNEVAMRHLADALPDPRLLLLLRDPADRTWSHYWHLRQIGNERRRFQRAVRDEIADPPGARGDPPRDYLQRSRYGEHLALLDELFDRSAVAVLLFDDLRDRPAELFTSVCRFLGIDADARPAALGRVENPRPRSPVVHQLLRRTRDRLPPRVVGWLERRTTGAPKPYPSMPEDVRRFLVHLFADDITAVESWTGRDLAAWRHITMVRDANAHRPSSGTSSST